jgi:probable phosphoglycerate mutase
MVQVILVRHGETAWSRAGRHTGRTDVPLTAHGEQQARALAPLLARWPIATVLCSPLDRARQTARLAGLPRPTLEPGLQEWDYGGYEGLTSKQIRAERPDWNLWRDGVAPGDREHPGETVRQVGRRADQVLSRVRDLVEDDAAPDPGAVALVGHGHALRVLAARWIGLPARCGALLRLDTATVSRLGYEHEQRVVLGWNITP